MHAAETTGREGAWQSILSVCSRRDLALYMLVAAFLFFAFEEHWDIFNTIACSVTYLEGHFADFYDINNTVISDVAYLPATYVVFALWGLPLKLVGMLRTTELPAGYSFLWFKLLTTCAYFSAGAVLYRIARIMQFSPKGAGFVAVAWLTTPLAVFSQFIFGQYDILMLLAVLLGFHGFVSGRRWQFVLCFAAATTFKYFPLALFFPLLLLAEKRLKELVWDSIAVVVPTILQIIPYWYSPAFQSGVLGLDLLGGPMAAVLVVSEGQTFFSYLAFTWFLVCGWSYRYSVSGPENLQRVGLYVTVGVTAIMFVLMPWHPNWLILVTPFLVLSAMSMPDRRFYLALDVIMMVAFTAFVVRSWPNNVDQHMWMRGVFGWLNPGLADKEHAHRMADLLPFSLGLRRFWLAFFNAGLVTAAFAWLPRRWEPIDTRVEDDPLIPQVLRWRFIIGVLVFLVPATVAFGLTLWRS